MTKEKVLIVGGGFAGIKTALELSKSDHFIVTLLTDNDHFTYYPTLYHVATGGSRINASIPLKAIFENSNVEIRIGKATKLDRKTKTITTDDAKSYDYNTLVLALGQVTNYFNIPGLAELSYSVKSIDEVERLKAHLHSQLISDHKPDLNYIIVGAGPTGVELAGALQSYLKRVMYWHALENRIIHIDLVEAAKRILPKMPPDMSRRIKRQLKLQGIKFYLGQAVEGEDANSILVNNKLIQSHTVIWTAGTANNPFFAANNFFLSANHKVATDVYLQAEPDIFVLGDNANTPYSGMAQTAIYDAKFLTNNLKRRARGRKLKSYYPKQPITVIPASEGWAGISWGRLRIYGWLGWLLRQAADARAFKDFEPWRKSLPQWFSYSSSESVLCPICAKHYSA